MFYLVLCFLFLLYYYLKISQSLKEWERKKVPHIKPWFLIGNMGPNLFQRQTIWQLVDEWYKEFSNSRYFGIYQFSTPTLVIKDPELIKRITVKDFEYFSDHKPFVPEGVDELWSKTLVASKGERWREMRPSLSPAFTSSKMKLMFTLMLDSSRHFIDHFAQESHEKTGRKTDVIDVELKDVFSRFTNDVIATTAFGVKCDSLKDKENSFYLLGKKLTDFGGIRGMKFYMQITPWIMKMLNMKVIESDVGNYFGKIIKNAIKLRAESGLVRHDMIHLLLEARKGKLKHEDDFTVETGFAAAKEYALGSTNSNWLVTDDDIVANALVFFMGGFDTVSALLCNIGYELMLNPDIQDKLRHEIDVTYEDCNGSLTYEALMKIKYLDMVVCESLRKWPPGNLTDRKCVKQYTIPSENEGETPVCIEVGDYVWLPIYSIHWDSEHFPNPEKFDPERFNDDNKHNIKPYTYIPFGSGPRNCIGSRFAILEAKVMYFYLLREFYIVPTIDSPIPVKWCRKNSMNFTPIGGFKMGFERRQLH